jgi:phenol 2-monooxygenase
LTANAAIGWLTISPTASCSPYEALGMEPFGDTYFDPSNVAHDKLGIDPDQGSLIILRPDGLLGCSGRIEGSWVKEYFAKIMR